MLFDVSSCLMIDFQCSAILSLLFCVLNLHWLKLPKLVNNHGRNCTKTSESHGECVSNYAYRNHFLKLFIICFHEAQSMMGILYTTFYVTLLKLACALLKAEVYNTGPTTRERPLPQFFSTESSIYSFFPLFFEIYCYFRLIFWFCAFS